MYKIFTIEIIIFSYTIIVCISYRIHNFPLIFFQSKRFLLFERLKSATVFVDFSAVTFSFPNDVISTSHISFIDNNMNIERWLPILIDHDIDVLVMSTSRLTVNCVLEKQVESYFDGFPESLGSNGNS